MTGLLIYLIHSKYHEELNNNYNNHTIIGRIQSRSIDASQREPNQQYPNQAIIRNTVSKSPEKHRSPIVSKYKQSPSILRQNISIPGRPLMDTTGNLLFEMELSKSQYSTISSDQDIKITPSWTINSDDKHEEQRLAEFHHNRLNYLMYQKSIQQHKQSEEESDPISIMNSSDSSSSSSSDSSTKKQPHLPVFYMPTESTHSSQQSSHSQLAPNYLRVVITNEDNEEKSSIPPIPTPRTRQISGLGQVYTNKAQIAYLSPGSGHNRYMSYLTNNSPLSEVTASTGNNSFMRKYVMNIDSDETDSSDEENMSSAPTSVASSATHISEINELQVQRMSHKRIQSVMEALGEEEEPDGYQEFTTCEIDGLLNNEDDTISALSKSRNNSVKQ